MARNTDSLLCMKPFEYLPIHIKLGTIHPCLRYISFFPNLEPRIQLQTPSSLWSTTGCEPIRNFSINYWWSRCALDRWKVPIVDDGNLFMKRRRYSECTTTVCGLCDGINSISRRWNTLLRLYAGQPRLLHVRCTQYLPLCVILVFKIKITNSSVNNYF